MLNYHGDDDCTVPPLQSRRLHEALTAAGTESILVEVRGEILFVGEFFGPLDVDACAWTLARNSDWGCHELGA